MLPTHPSKDLISSVVGSSPKDEKNKRFHCLSQASVTEPIAFQLIPQSPARSLYNREIPLKRNLAYHSPGQELSIASLGSGNRILTSPEDPCAWFLPVLQPHWARSVPIHTSPHAVLGMYGFPIHHHIMCADIFAGRACPPYPVPRLLTFISHF